MSGPDWANGLEWQPGYSFAAPTERMLAQGQGGNYQANLAKFATNDTNAALLKSLGYGGQAVANARELFGYSPDSEYNGPEQVWTPEALSWLNNNGYSIGVGYVPGSKPGGRAEFSGLLDKDGKFVGGQSDPNYVMTDTFMDNVVPFLMMAGPFASAISTAGELAAAGGAGAAGGGAAGGVAGGTGGIGGASGATLGATEAGVSAMAPEAIGAVTPGVSASELVALSQPLPGAVGGSTWLEAMGSGALKGAGMGALKGAVTGQDILKSAAQGAIGGAVGGAVSGFNPAGSLGIQSATGQGLVNGAISGGLRAGVGGGDVVRGAITGGVTGGVNGLNPGSAVFDSKQGQGLINSLVSGAVLGRDPSQLAQQAIGGAVGLAGSKVGDLVTSLGTNGGLGDLQSFDSPGEYDPDALNKGNSMDEEGESYDWDTWDKAVEDYMNNRGEPADDPDNRDLGGGFWTDQDRDPANLPDNRDIGDGSTGSAQPGTGSSGGGSNWFDTILKGLGIGGSSGGSGGVTGTGRSGSTLFGADSLLGSLFGGVQGKDVLGMLGSGVASAMLERQAQANRDFQKELQDRQWAREDTKEAERRARFKPVSGPGLLNAQFSTIPGGSAARVGG